MFINILDSFSIFLIYFHKAVVVIESSVIGALIGQKCNKNVMRQSNPWSRE